MSFAAFLTFLCISKSWRPTELTLRGDIIAFRFLLFLSHVYGAAVLLCCPLIALEALGRARRSRLAPSHTDGGCSRVGEAAEGTEEGGEKLPSHGVSFLCCLSVWVTAALHVRWQWMLEEARAAACLHVTDSPLTCLPRLTISTSSSASLCIGVTLLLLLLFLLKAHLRGRRRASAGPAQMHKQNQGRPQGPILAGLPRTLVSADGRRVDPEKPVGGCVVLSNSHEPSPAGQKQERTKTPKPLTFMAEAQDCVWCHWAFPCLGLNGIIGLMGVLCIFALPLILSVSIVFIQTVDYLTEESVQALVASLAGDKSNMWTCHEAAGRSTRLHRWKGSSCSQTGNNLEIC